MFSRQKWHQTTNAKTAISGHLTAIVLTFFSFYINTPVLILFTSTGMPDSKLEIVVSEAPNKAIKGILNVYMENFSNSEVLLF